MPRLIIMANLTENQKRDYEMFFVEKGDPGFSPEHNRYVIEKTIRENDKLALKKRKEYRDKLAERTEAAASYIMYLERGGAAPAEKYFGRRFLAYLQGRKIIKKLIEANNKSKRFLLMEGGEY